MKAADARVLLTGATGGIGREIAALLLHRGASVMLTGRSGAALAGQARQLAKDANLDDRRVTWFAADLAAASGIEALAEGAAAWNANVLIHCAGRASFGRLETLHAGAMQEVLQTNLLAPMLLTQSLLPHLLSQPQAQVIAIGSALGRIGLPGYSVYSASKFGLRGFTEALRRELAGTAVRIQYLGPRSTLTDFNDDRVHAYNHATGTHTDAASTVAWELLQLLEGGQAERFIGFPEKWAVRLNGFAPHWLDGSFRQHRNSLPSPYRAPAKPGAPALSAAAAHSPTPSNEDHA